VIELKSDKQNIGKQKVLIVDDATDNIQLLFSMLQDDYDVLFATTGKKALQIASESEPDIILLDIVMPEMDGYEVITRLKDNTETQDIPVIFLTAKTDKLDLLKGFQLGSVDYITKPFFAEEIKARIKTHLQNRLLVKQLKIANQKLEKISLSDGLTGVANRRYFDQFLAQVFSLEKRDKKPISLLFIDVDYFKNYNDIYGHPAGDQCLKNIAFVIKSFAQRGGDLAARYGGEEFSLILTDTGLEDAQVIAGDCCIAIQNLKQPHAKSAASDYVTVSIGISTATGTSGETVENLIHEADIALYKAKEAGRNQYSI